MRKNYFLVLFSLFVFNLSFSQILDIDVGVEYIISPVDTVRERDLIIPQAVVKNYGTFPATFRAIFKIGNIYEDTALIIGLLPNSVDTVSFALWPAVRGNYVVSCSTLLLGGENPNNDKKDSSLFVIYHDVGVGYIIEPVDTVLEGQLIM
ncbi:MAG: hypothetical protein N2323_02945, partial [candidate division WOR-3 bacterium]|nr:hypothetical protein [candidate division WOR-3 bacterium]